MNLETNPKHVRLTLARAARWTVLLACGAASMSARADEVKGVMKDPNAQALSMTSFTPSLLTASLVEAGVDATGKVALTVNKTAVVTTKEKYKRISVGQPEIADVTAVGPNTLLVTAKKYGSTQLTVWDEQERSQSIDITVAFDIQELSDQLKKISPDAPVTVEMLNGTLVLKGRVPSLAIADQAVKIANAFSKDVLNFLEVSGGQQIQLQVQFIEMSRKASTQLGFRAYLNDGNSFGFNNGPGASTWGGLISGNSSQTISDAVSFFGTGNLGSTPFEIFISALKSNNLARTLAEPTLTAINGQEASFLAGGEIPIPVPQAGSGGSTITIEYKEFGVRLKYTAIILGDGRIKLKVAPEVSELDYANGTSINGQPVPGIRTRKVDTAVEMSEGQTFALAGLLQRRVDSTVSATPLLGDLPVIGAFFRNTSYTRQETELVILVTPHLASPMNPAQTPALPGDKWRYPNEWQLFGMADQGGPEWNKSPLGKSPIADVPAPRFIGPHGFDEAAPVQSEVATTDEK